jgi:ketosteroid isomerase-like protein/predicted aspartyl protease
VIFMSSKAILSLTYIVLVLVSGNSFVTGQTPQIERRPVRQMPDMRLPSVTFPAGKSFIEVPFEVAGNWMVIPVSVNGSRPLRFVLDTGASATVFYNAELVDSLNIKITGTMPIRGAGGGGAASEVSIAENVGYNIGGIEFSGGRLALRNSSRSGADGVIGRIVFATLVVEVDWEKRAIKLYDPAKYKYAGNGAVLPLTFDEGGRPYTMANVVLSGDKKVPVKLVVDTGGSHTLSLDVGSKPEIMLPEGARKTVLGRGGSGEITGHTGRIKSFELGGQLLKDVPTDFPDESAGTAGIGGRQGNLGSGVLRRFKIIYDYSRKQMIVEPNRTFADLFAPTLPTTAAANTDVSPSSFHDLIGSYGERTISAEGNSLFIQRPGGRKLMMVAASAKDEFTLEQIPAARIKFVRGEAGKVTEIQVLNQQGQWESSKKEHSKLETTVTNQPNDKSQNEQTLSQPERDVRKLEREWLDAYEKRDAEAMNRIVADDFKLIFPDGRTQTKADILAQLKSEQHATRPSPKFSTEDVRSRVEGDTVILTGRVVQTIERGGQTRTMQMRYADKYRKRHGSWQVISSELSRIQP